MSVAKSGFEKTNPAYEEYYSREVPVGTPSRLGAGWVYPRCFVREKPGCCFQKVRWVVVTARPACVTSHPMESIVVGFADPRETMSGQPANPSSKLRG